MIPQPKPWLDQTAVVIATGPSLSDDQLETVRQAGVRSITVNNAFERAPWADAFYAGDYMFWKVHHQRMQTLGRGKLWTADRSAAERFKLGLMKPSSAPGLGTERVHMNGNSGAQAVNVATLWGAKRVVLIGFDMREVDGKAHYHGQHPKPLTQRQLFGEWIHKFAVIAEQARARGIEIINATPGSALQCFPMLDLKEALA